MKTETEIREWLNQVIEKMKAIKADSESDLYGQPKKNNYMIRASMMKESLELLNEAAVLYQVLEEKIPKEVFDLTP